MNDAHREGSTAARPERIVFGGKRAGVGEWRCDLAWPTFGARAMNVLILVSSLGAINGMIFTTARIYSTFGVDHRIFKTMSHWSRRWREASPDAVSSARYDFLLYAARAVLFAFIDAPSG